MRIQSSNLNLTGSSQSINKEEKKEQLTLWTGEKSRPGSDVLELSAESQKELRIALSMNNLAAVHTDEECFEVSDRDKLKIKLIESFIETLTGKKIRIRTPKIKLKDFDKTIDNHDLQAASPSWGLVYDYYETHYEKESMSFSAQGIVKTDNGREIKINIKFNIAREFMEQRRIHLTAGNAKKVDPLVINYTGGLPELTEKTFIFDLDFDGRPDQISFLQQNSGFLSLDLNNDGIINDGRELFGPQSGDGFSDLAVYDDDNNSWIDENDGIFHRLRIWTKDATGNDYLLSLGEVGIGAIYLGWTKTLFSFRGQDNRLLGEIQKTGLFLKDNGTAGIVQHIDLAI